MNKIFFKTLIFGVLSIVMILSACKKDDSESNYFSIFDITNSKSKLFDSYSLKYCSIMKSYETDKGTYEYYLMLSTSSIKLSEFSYPDTKGDYVILWLYSEDETLPSGQYTYDPFVSEDKFTVRSSSFDDVYDFSSGVINIIHNGNRITLDFEFYGSYISESASLNLKLEGYYSGTVKELIKPTK
jgi:hypothetical protein